jgi:hypothetical protein
LTIQTFHVADFHSYFLHLIHSYKNMSFNYNNCFYAAQSFDQTVRNAVNTPFTEIPSYDPPPYEYRIETFLPNESFESSSSFDIPISIHDEREENGNTERRLNISAPHVIFPTIYLNRLHTVPITHSLHTTDQPPIGFDHEFWRQVWYSAECELDHYLTYARSTDTGIFLPWTLENTFNGAPYRLSISHYREDDNLPIFKRGMTISFSNCNGLDYRYVIDHCVHVDDFNAYVKVICFDSFQGYYNICSYRPPLILSIPKSHCQVRMHPNLEIQKITPPSPTPQKSSSPSLWRRFFHKI